MKDIVEFIIDTSNKEPSSQNTRHIYKLIIVSSGHLARECDRRRERTNEGQVSLDLTVHTKSDTDSHVIIRSAVLGSSK